MAQNYIADPGLTEANQASARLHPHAGREEKVSERLKAIGQAPINT
jgi:hypothetical protein